MQSTEDKSDSLSGKPSCEIFLRPEPPIDKPSMSKNHQTTTHIKSYVSSQISLDLNKLDSNDDKADLTLLEVAKLTGNKPPLYTKVEGPELYIVNDNIVSKPIILKNVAEQFKSLPIFGRPKNKNELPEFFKKKIRDFVGGDMNDDQFSKLTKYCSPDHLRTGNELQMLTNYPTTGPFPTADKFNDTRAMDVAAEVPPDLNLNLIKKLQFRLDSDKANYYCKKLKYRGVRLMPLSTCEEEDNPKLTIERPLEPGVDLVIKFRIYRPFPHNMRNERRGGRASVFSCDAVLLGRQPLSALRDRIVCANDVGTRTDRAAAPDAPLDVHAKTVFPSGFLFINNVFYVDDRPGCHDTSAPIRAWAERRGMGSFPKRPLSTRLQDLPLRLGHPEVYVHQGDCEHPLTASLARVGGARDAHARFPARTAAAAAQSLYCTTCAEFGARWLVRSCLRVPFDPAFFCDTCFRMYMYKKDKPLGAFEAYHYPGNDLNTLKPQG